MTKGHKIEKTIDVKIFLETIKNYTPKQIITTQHTFFRFNELERKIFKEEVLKEYLLTKIPLLVGIQFNGSYAIFYNYDKRKALRLILDIQSNKMEIVTFYLSEKTQIPKL